MAEDEDNILLTDFLKEITGNIGGEHQTHLNMILPFWNERKEMFTPQTSNFIHECIIQAEHNGFHFYKHNHGFVTVLNLPKKNARTRKTLLETFFRRIGDGEMYGGKNALQYLIGELIDNIYQHSNFSNAYLGVEQFDDLFFICICDDGITIKESLKQVQPGIKDGCEALIKALQGESSKNEERGWGLSSSVDIARNGYHAEILVASSDGALWINNNEQKIFNLEDKSYHGTFLGFLMVLPMDLVDIYDYI